MGQEDVENKISFDCLRTVVDEAIKTKNICIIEGIEKEKLRYAQKYAELLVSEKEAKISFESYFVGVDSVSLALIAIGVSYILFGVYKNPAFEPAYFWLGIVMAIIGFWVLCWKKPQTKKEFEVIKEDIKFAYTIILKIEERLSNRT